MDRAELIKKAGIYHNRVFANGGCYRPTNGTEPLITTFLTNFAAEILPERDAEIADNIIQLHQNHKTNELFLRELSYFVHELKGGNATAHAMFDEIREAELESLRRTTCPECGCGI